MDSLKINAYKPQYNYNPSFQGRLKSLNDLNPISRYADNYFRKVAQISREKFHYEIPELTGLIDIVKINTTKRITISAWDINPTKSENYVLFLHGMSQNISNYQTLYRDITKKNIGVFAIEYRGYGTSDQARFSEDKLRHDVAAAYKYLTETKGIKPENITVLGHSMGGALATNLASQNPYLRSLILICPIVNASKIGEKFALNKTVGEGIPVAIKNLTDKIKPLNWLYSLRLNSLNKMKTNEVPTYIIQSKNDTVTPMGPMRTLAKVAKRRGILKDVCILNSGGHVVDKAKIETVTDILEKIYK